MTPGDEFSHDDELLTLLLTNRRFATAHLTDLTTRCAVEEREPSRAERIGLAEDMPAVVEDDSSQATGLRAAFSAGYWIGRTLLGTDAQSSPYDGLSGEEADNGLLRNIRGYREGDVGTYVIGELALQPLVLDYARQLEERFGSEGSGLRLPIPILYLLPFSGGMTTALAEHQVLVGLTA